MKPRISELHPHSTVHTLTLTLTLELHPQSTVHILTLTLTLELHPQSSVHILTLTLTLELHPQSSVHVTGHSLGAALAHVGAVDLYNNGIPVASSITFGSPRTGNQAFSKYYTKTGGLQWRVTHYRDPIVHLPPNTFGAFTHVPTEYFFYKKMGLAYKECDGSVITLTLILTLASHTRNAMGVL